MATETTDTKKRRNKRRTEDDDAANEPTNSTVASLIASFGSAEAALLQLSNENHKLRGKNRTLREENEELEAQAPEGSVVLTGEDAQGYKTLAALKDALKYGEGDPAKILAMLKEHGELSGKFAGLEKESNLRQVAEAAGVSFEVLKTLGADLEYEVQSVTGPDGKPVTAVSVKYMDGETQKAKPFGDYVKETWPAFAPSLYAKEQNGKPKTPGAPLFVPQTPAPKSLITAPAAPGAVVSTYVKNRNAARSGVKPEAKE